MGRAVLFALALTAGSLAQQVTRVATFNNVGIEVTFSAPTAAGSTIAVAINNAGATQAWRECHPLSRVAADRFAGSIFGLAPGTRYSFRLQSSLLTQDIVDTVTTRSDVFAASTGQETHAVNAAPGFVDAASGDIGLLPTSAMVDKGVAIPGINDGYAGSAPDMGRFEVSGSRVVQPLRRASAAAASRTQQPRVYDMRGSVVRRGSGNTGGAGGVYFVTSPGATGWTRIVVSH